VSEVETIPKVGKKYRCRVCDAQVICVKAEGGTLRCHGTPVEAETPAALPATD
jgi:hypothetical protein